MSIPHSNGLGATWGLKATNVVHDRPSPWTGRGIRVALLDSGIDLAHPDLKAQIVSAESFVPGYSPQDTLGHGTHCAGTVAGSSDPKGRRYGIACGAELYVARVLDEEGRTGVANVIAGMDWAVSRDCHVISMSIGTCDSAPSEAFEAAGRRALEAGCLVIAAAGNVRTRVIVQPANAESIMAVGAVDNWLRIAYFCAGESARDSEPTVDIVAPGVNVYSTALGQSYASRDGTSMATAHVAGIAALWAEAEGLRGRALWQRLLETAQPPPLTEAGMVTAP